LIPIRFGSTGRQLFGVYQEPASLHGCIVFCNPFGQEAIRSHRLFKVLADRLCRGGYAVLRFDYFGTGDSGGKDDEATLAGFVADLFVAQEELTRRCGSRDLSWIGLRLGATVAARAATDLSTPLSRLVLWEPVISGAHYLDELAEAQALAMEDAFGARCLIDKDLRALLAAEAGHEALGFPITAALRQEIEALRPESVRGIQARRVDAFFCEALAGSAQAAGIAAFDSALRKSNVDLHVNAVKERIVWTADEMMNAATVPGEALQRIANCFAAAA
jgi:uncharacterized protein